jgi:quercetin dioxygenase-like cupin family protein
MAQHSEKFLIAAERPKEDMGGGITRQILGYDESLMVVRVWFEENAIGYTHDHHHAQVAYVESGTFDFMVDGETRHLVAGDSVYIPPHAPHGATCTSAGVLLDTFSPAREDFLEDK